jgi:hypothetical protein
MTSFLEKPPPPCPLPVNEPMKELISKLGSLTKQAEGEWGIYMYKIYKSVHAIK